MDSLQQKIIDSIAVKGDSIAIVGIHEGVAGQIYEWIKEKYHVACFVNFSAEVLDIDIESEKKKRECQTFEYPQKDSFKNIPLITSLEYIDILEQLGIRRVIIALSSNQERFLNIQEVKKREFEILSVIHPSAIILDEAKISEGALIFAGTLIGYKAEIREGALINTKASIDHHSIVKECAMIDPGVVLAGNVTIGKGAYIFTNTTVINKVWIGDNAVVGAGAVVLKNIPANTLSVGVPSKVIKEDYLI